MNFIKRLLVTCMSLSVVAIICFTFFYRDEAWDLFRLKLSPDWDLDAIPAPDTLVDLPEPEVIRRANASFIMLVRNTEIDGALSSIKELETRFNSRYKYPYVFLNDEPFSDDFKRVVRNAVSSIAEFGQIPYEHWNQPSWINETEASKARERMAYQGVKYGVYRKLSEFLPRQAGTMMMPADTATCVDLIQFFFKHELMQKYRWYWRIEPSVHFHCNINYDPFLFMQDHNKTYSFTIATYEIMQSIPSLWTHVKALMKLHPEHIADKNSMDFLSPYGVYGYNGCHFWSNFELADMDFWRSKAYTDYFEYLDSQGGFYYERWGDAPVHSIAVSLMLPRDKIHFFEDIGYQHDMWSHCPLPDDIWKKGECDCDRSNSFDYDQSSCMKVWENNVRRLN